jgi:16S rRNA (cytidine1402-2'-O)-methyltransferase
MKLTIVPTPIGNLDDITLRAIKVLQEADAILCEDTRTSGRLLHHLQIQKPLIPYHQHNEHLVAEKITDRLLSGEKLALVSDAGTPGISDAAFFLVRKCIEKNILVDCLPGATAFVPALVNSGFPTNRFCFEGFLPHKKGRQTRLKILALETRTIVLYESPHRLIKCLQELNDYLGAERQVSVSRELTKFYEETVRGAIPEVKKHFELKPAKGEIVIIVEGAEKD